MKANPPAEHTRKAREALIRRFFQEGIPRLWCPTLTHFSTPGQLDEMRIRKQWEYLSPYVKGVLVPGSTGEGWEMNDDDILQLLGVILDIAGATGIRVLIGVLKTDVSAMLESIEATMIYLKDRTGLQRNEDVLLASHVVGFTVCPPKGSQLSQSTLTEGLTEVAQLGLPLAVYQLPQVTGNEMTAETIEALAGQFPGFFLFKDTSGTDRVALSDLDFNGVFLVRGAEGSYHRWQVNAGGPYHGFLLSTANVFASQLTAVQTMLDVGQVDQAATLSGRISRVVEGCFRLVEDFPSGNAFTNANKVLDHIMAHGEEALEMDPPLLYSGIRLPGIFIEHAADLLHQEELFPVQGYL